MVDDEREIREIISFVLVRHGFEVVAVCNGQQLQRQLVLQLPDLIILDVMMPGEDGYHICSCLRSDPATQHIPIVMITAHPEDIYERISSDLGAVEHITKPFHPLEIAERVRVILSAEVSS